MDGTVFPSIPDLCLQDGVTKEQVNASTIAIDWLSKLQLSFDKKSFDDLSGLFLENCWWRDWAGLTWDIRTQHGREAISTYLRGATNQLTAIDSVKSGGLQPALSDIGGTIWIQSGFTFRTPHGEGKGLVRLVNIGPQEWKAWTVFTQLEQFDFKKKLDVQRDTKTAQPRAAKPPSAAVGPGDDLPVLIVGAGQSGLMVGARLKSMGIKYLIVDQSDRIGGRWNDRYNTMTMHTPIYSDHYPFVKYPSNWPKWLNKDDLIKFMVHYADLLDLDISLSTNVTKIAYDESAKRYQVELKGPNGEQRLSPRQVVLALGLFGDRPNIPDIPGRESFKGLEYHAIKHKSARQVPDLDKKKVAVIGSSTTAHDLAQDFVNCGAKEVTMIQRSPIFSMSSQATEAIMFSTYGSSGLSTEEADIVANSFPIKLVRAMSIGITQMASQIDKEMLDGLKKAGLALKTGQDGYGILDHQLIYGGRFYFDQGANEMIIDGRIKVRSCQDGISKIHANGLTLADGTDVDADVIVLATGYKPPTDFVERLMGPDGAKKAGPFTGWDSEHERKGCWRPMGLPGLWYMTGSFTMCRALSLPLSLQIAAVEKGFNAV
ncbi:flavin-containing monooxygenase [Xylariaceae sp. FL1019]|nr:flavin-containing monooxygenase [Xylariaceae sp. FL1019]